MATFDVHALDEAFDRDRFLLKQKRLAINEKYFVSDDQNQHVLFVERPQRLLQQLGALGASAGALLIIGVTFTAITASLEALPEGARVAIAFVGWLLAGLAAAAAFCLLNPKRHVTFYRNESRNERLLSITQENRVQILFARFTILDEAGAPLARLRKNQLTNLFRKRWVATHPDGGPLCVAMEDSILLSVLRRLLGPLFGALRTNFILCAGDGADERLLGKFDRKFTLFDQYVLDLTADPRRELDRRVALAIGVLLDTGEKR